ncbi:hypothetical protein LC613_14025 [Nostoc sphaeroides CHAB 2801]|uniref:Uncharacterized protein n=1 Tax=Nostoc sphaeroides CCNUC1 TaxID=2653204 RepID=A0A5P8VW61_9NOSO|nr:hypothetical protein [Nostoc sphaeroides]MCC5629133.1 hypothetical protein [Nostoc sphaeroides CHAB 2801]QFS44604.1 hypothetical protein GXM_02079 [Nostoc sphaeroides CCNUC1]
MLKHDQLQNSNYLNLAPISGDRSSILTLLVRSQYKALSPRHDRLVISKPLNQAIPRSTHVEQVYFGVLDLQLQPVNRTGEHHPFGVEQKAKRIGADGK